ncbi:D-alanyl-D-alanine carboxypeptidase family protein [Aestuariivirga sp.]|uniref:D-alanyl-D-alanine carboxypeptidase family protein n=1 Tax=Aestuariivirga sp. TaxID=2650926 RepID=UPI0038D1CB35
MDLRICTGTKRGLWRLLAVIWLAVLAAGLAPEPALANSKFAAITVDARTGKILHAENADAVRHPASLTKMMTLYIVFEELQAGRLTLQTPIRFSARAAGMAPSKLGVKAGGTITVETAIQALVVKSANDAATAVAEQIAGSEKAFAQRMTSTARTIGMPKTTFMNASGLPNPKQVTTARDMATLGLRLMRDYPQYYPYFRTRSFVFQGRTIKGHNKLLGAYEGTDGIKTGFINASGFNLVSSVRRGDKRLVGVVMGGRTGATRDAYMRKMLSQYFDDAKSGKTIAAIAGSSKGAAAVETAENAKPPKSKQKPAKDEVAKAAPKTEPVTEEGDTGGGGIGELAADAAPTPETPAAPPAEQVETVPQPADVPFEVKTPEQQLADKAQVASITPAADAAWIIILGDYPAKTDAQAMLQLMRKRTPEALAGKTAQTVMIEKSGKVTFRARFIGFDEAAAAAACEAIRKQKTSCRAQGPS